MKKFTSVPSQPSKINIKSLKQIYFVNKNFPSVAQEEIEISSCANKRINNKLQSKLELDKEDYYYNKNSSEIRHYAEEILSSYFMSLDVDRPMKTAYQLLDYYGSISSIMQASSSELTNKFEISYKVARNLHLAKELFQHAAYEKIARGELINSWKQLLDYLNLNFKGLVREQLRVLFLNNKNFLIANELLSKGTINYVPMFIRDIMQFAFTYNASSVIMVHNHPSGDPTPSEADIEMTRLLISALSACNISLHDHIIIGHDHPFSMRSNKCL